MSRFLLSGFGSLLLGATFWAVFGSLAAVILSRMPGGAREGGGAMAGFFFVGPAAGFIGLLLGGWAFWTLLAKPERTGAVAVGLVVHLVVLIIGVTIALQPKIVERDDYPGVTVRLLVEVDFPASQIDALGKNDHIYYEFRSADGEEMGTCQRDQIRHEGGRAILPGVFPTKTYPRSKIFAVMKNDRQLMATTLIVDGDMTQSTEWSAWQDLEEGLRARWRLMVGRP
jgi:hypothetical protein